MFKSVIVLACGIFILTGCKSTPPAWKKDTSGLSPFTNVVVSPKPAVVLTNVPTHIPTNVPVVVTPAVVFRTNEFPETWVSLNRWSMLRGFGTIRRLPVGTPPTFLVHTSNGMLVMQAQSQTAYWDEVELHLGFMPQLVGGQIFIHRLDLLKNIEPLLHEPQLASNTNRVIIIDPGHGGDDSGAVSVVDGRFEKQFNLDLALRLAPLLQANGWQVFLTRTNDVAVSLANRVAFAESHKADLFVSLHFNSSSPDQTASGLTTFCLTPTGMASTLTRDYSDDASLAFPNNTHDVENWEYAFKVHRALLDTHLLADRGLQHARFMGVLRGQNRPSILIEGGYLSNPTEARQIADPAFRQKLAEAIAKGLR